MRSTAASHINRQERNHYRLRPGPKVSYNKIWFIYSDIARRSNTDADAEEHRMWKRGSSFASQSNVPTDKPRPHRPKTPPTPARIKTNKKRAAHIFTFNSDTDNN